MLSAHGGGAVRTDPAPAGSETDAQVLAVVDAVEQLRRVAGRMWSLIEDELGVTDAQASVLEAIANGAQQVSTVADRCGRHISSASRVIDGLVSRGLLARATDPDDRRAVRLSLTADGEVVSRRILAAHAEVLRRSLEQFGDDDARRFVELIGRFATAAETVVDDVSV